MFYNLLKTKYGTFALSWKDSCLLRLDFPSSTPTAMLKNCEQRIPGTRKKNFSYDIKLLSEQLINYMSESKPIEAQFEQYYDDGYSDFQKKVFNEVKKIPFASNKSYLELAKKVGCANGARAVGQALKNNKTPVFIPCHRVISSRGDALGYSAEGGSFWQELFLYLEIGKDIFNRSVSELVTASNHIARYDSKLRKIIRFHGPAALPTGSHRTLFQTLVRTIIGQQLSVTAAKSIHDKLSKAIIARLTPNQFLKVDKEHLRGCGLSYNKIGTLTELANLFLENHFPSDKVLNSIPDTEVDKLLIQIKGVGRWTCDIVKLFHLRRLNTLPEGDLGIRNGFKKFYGVDIDSKQGNKITGSWSPFRGVACWYLWKLAEYNSFDLNFIDRSN